MSTVKLRLSRRDSRREELEECLSLDEEECLLDRSLSFRSDEEWCLEEELLECDLDEDLCSLELDEDFSDGTSRMLRVRPVVGSVVEDCPGSWETWYPSMM
jgi:hypothetical protein